MDALLIRWDRLVMALIREDELCQHPESRITGHGVTRSECARRWSHTGRHVQRDLP